MCPLRAAGYHRQPRILAVTLSIVASCLAVPAFAQQEPLGKPAASFSRGAREASMPLAVDSVLRTEPSTDSPVVAQLRRGGQGVVLETRDGWVRVEVPNGSAAGTVVGWVLLEDPANGAMAVADQRGRVDMKAVDAARRVFRDAGNNDLKLREWGGFRLLTDWQPRREASRRSMLSLERLAEALPAVYAARYGLPQPSFEVRPVVILFARERDYRRYIGDAEDLLAEVSAGGHAASGVLAVSLQDREFEAIAALLVHELTHLFNEVSFPRALPIWLEEGLAEDMAISAIDPDGTIDVERLRGRSQVTTFRQTDDAGREILSTAFSAEGPRVNLGRLLNRARASRRIELGPLLQYGWEDFVLSEERQQLYWKLGFLVRFLVTEHQTRFLSLLNDARSGSEATAERLLARVELSQQELEEGFYLWASFRSVKTRQPR
jgi:hypothetical protein